MSELVSEGSCSFDHVERLLSEEWTVLQWLNEQTEHLAPLVLKADHSLVSKYTSHIDSLMWQIEQLELKKSIEFETLASQYVMQIPKISNTLRGLWISQDMLGPLQKLESDLSKAELVLNTFMEIRNSKEVERIRSLQNKKKVLIGALQRGEMELDWRKEIASMEQSMQKDDIDSAQASLERLDELLTSSWSGDKEKSLKLEDLRLRLVNIIRNM